MQCLSCKKRQVKCDSSPGACKRCERDNIICPGYRKPLKWNHYNAPHRPGARMKRVSADNFEHMNLQLTRLSAQHDKDIALVMESVDYFNTSVVPYVSPQHLPFKRNFVPGDFWPYVPTILQDVWIVICKTTQCWKSLCDPILNSDLCYYRGRGLTALQKMLSDTHGATTDPHALALISVLFIMAADMQLCEEHWTTHLEAARRIIFWRGGFEACLASSGSSDGPLINYLYTDVITATTCNTWLLNSRAVKSQFEYLRIIPEIEQQLIANGHPCPWEIFYSITATNILRVTSSRPLTKDERQLMLLEPIEFSMILDVIEGFDANLWAYRISRLGRSLPQKVDDELEEVSISCLTSLGECFKSAALIYLLLSSSNESFDIETIVSAKDNLSYNLMHLFGKASTNIDGPLYSRLWIFTVWPIFVSGYTSAGWDIRQNLFDTDVGRLNALMTAFCSGRLSDAEKLLRTVMRKRAAMSDSGKWNWDDAFASRCSFVF